MRPSKLEQLVQDGDLVETKPFQPYLFSKGEMYRMWGQALPESEQKINKEFGVVPLQFVFDYYGVEPTSQFYYRR